MPNKGISTLVTGMRVEVNDIDKYTYPDIVVVCGSIELEKVKGVETLLNPVVIIEILSGSTEAYDREKKIHPLSAYSFTS